MSIAHLTRGLRAPAPSIGCEEAQRIALRALGIPGACRRLAGERDLNFCLTEPGGTRHLLKFWNRERDPAAIDFQLQALAHIARVRPELPVPRPEHPLPGQPPLRVQDADGRWHLACLLSWLDGKAARGAAAAEGLRTALGAALAELGQALESFSHPAEQRDLLWDVSRTGRLRELADSTREAGLGALVGQALGGFERTTRPALQELPRQVIHGDFNPDNVLIASGSPVQVSGIVDFGDALRAPRVCDLAIACAYQLDPGPDPLAGALPLIRAYHRVTPLLPGEQQVLPGLIRARLLGSVIITSHMARLHPDNRDYLLIDTAAAGEYLQCLGPEPATGESGRIEAACRDA
jgi:Ser/Thr protein kinase RdoA (MazF antagonist)